MYLSVVTLMRKYVLGNCFRLANLLLKRPTCAWFVASVLFFYKAKTHVRLDKWAVRQGPFFTFLLCLLPSFLVVLSKLLSLAWILNTFLHRVTSWQEGRGHFWSRSAHLLSILDWDWERKPGEMLLKVACMTAWPCFLYALNFNSSLFSGVLALSTTVLSPRPSKIKAKAWRNDPPSLPAGF